MFRLFIYTILVQIFLGFTLNARESEKINPWDLHITERILNRKIVNNLLIDSRRDEYRLVILASERFPYNYKSQSIPFFFRLRNIQEAYRLMEKIDVDLESGEELTIKLNGSEIKGVIFHEPYEELP